MSTGAPLIGHFQTGGGEKWLPLWEVQCALSPPTNQTSPHSRQRVPAGAKRIKYVHGTAENSGVPDSSVDCLLFQYIIHECPQRTIQNFCREGFRMVKPGGAVMFVDNNPRSKTIQGLSPAIATLVSASSTSTHRVEGRGEEGREGKGSGG